ncbi:NfeD family protein [Methanocaldococcus infernus]|uniref:NfeD-like C-terminal domain-containing protein n=1 Tax=Methanocaldococcus infernus (strain DSM 11812 / JCM 15783 / ME) TaxID=573063 RepID=D5VTN5_METIM|nr:NfeD family protein [Methanocaldococcus infernus]ADG13938.1 protein of unknown function DUF107 [Methanocaldococcus infernus ME]
MVGYLFILLGLLAIVAEIVTPGLYMPALGIALIIYGIFLMIMPNLSLISAILAGLLTIVVLNKFVYSVKSEVKVGVERLINKEGYALEDFDEEGFGRVEVEGENWLARGEGIKKGDKVIVIGYEGTTLKVKKVEE